MKTTTLLATLTLTAALALSGCGAKDDGAANKDQAVPAATEQAASKATPEDIMKAGTAKLLKTAKQLRKAATAGDEAKVKEYGPALEEAWGSYEDEVKAKYPDLYEKVEENLDPTIAGTKASTFNKEAVLKLDNQLLEVLYDLSEKLIPVEEVKAGAEEMIAITGELRKEIDAGNEAKVKELGPKLEEVWGTFEDGLKPRNEALYEKIEESLNPEVAGAEKSPMDKEVMAKLNDSLEQSLKELAQSLK